MAVKVGDGIVEDSSSDRYDQVIFTQNIETIEAFSSHMVLVKGGKAYTGQCVHIMVQALQTEDSSFFRASLYKTHTQSWGKEVKRQLWW